MEPEASKIPPSKITFLGDASVGKSSLVGRFVRNEFSNDTHSTIGAAFSTLKYNKGGKQRVLHLWDTAGQERYFSLIPLYLSGATVIVIVYDITNRDSYDDIAQKWLPFIKRNLRLKDGDAMPAMFLVGNKCDLVESGEQVRQVSRQEAFRFASENELGFMEVSAKTGQGTSDIVRQITTFIDKTIVTQAEHIRLEESTGPTEPWTCWGTISGGFLSKFW